MVSADGFEPVTTHIFDDIDEYLTGDAVFAVKDSLICTFEQHDTFCTAHFDFVLQQKTA